MGPVQAVTSPECLALTLAVVLERSCIPTYDTPVYTRQTEKHETHNPTPRVDGPDCIKCAHIFAVLAQGLAVASTTARSHCEDLLEARIREEVAQFLGMMRRP